MAVGVTPGEVLEDRYRVERLVGSTMTSAVYAGTHLQLDQRVAIKVMLDMDSPTAVKRFRREAKLMGRIQSDHVVRVSDFGVVRSRTPYIVMEYLEGTDLQQMLKDKGPFEIELACNYVLQACEGLASAHAVGIMHRDIKPSNLFLVPRPGGSSVIKIIDFGIAKVPQGVDQNDTFTRSDALIGTPRYMSPEQTKGRVADVKTDVWSLAVVLQELITGRPVFKADSLPQLFVKILNDDPPSLRDGRPDAPEELASVVKRALAKGTDERLSLAAFSHGLVPFAGRGADERAARIEARSMMRPPEDSQPFTPEEAEQPPVSWDHTTKREGDAIDARADRTTEPEPLRVHDEAATLSPVEPSPRLVGRRRLVAVVLAAAAVIGGVALYATNGKRVPLERSETLAPPPASIASVVTTVTIPPTPLASSGPPLILPPPVSGRGPRPPAPSVSKKPTTPVTTPSSAPTHSTHDDPGSTPI